MNNQPQPKTTMNRDDMIMEWHASQEMLAELKEREMNLRKQLIEGCFDGHKEGTQNVELGNDYVLKGVIKKIYKLDMEEDRLSAALDQLDEKTADDVVSWTPVFDKESYLRLSADERLIANRAFSAWTPSLNKKEYLKLGAMDSQIMSVAVITSFGAPTLKLIEPKAKGTVPTLVK